METAMRKMDAGRHEKGLKGWWKRTSGAAQAGLAFARLYLIPVKHTTPPASPRLQPAY
jgi:magnesium-protoporphyrin IX monomethyl ester (oxidative) cyclase